MLSKLQLEHLDREGYLVVKDLLDPKKDLDPILDELSTIADGLAVDLLAKQQIPQLYQELPFGKRLTRIIAETGQSHSQHFDFSLPKGQIGSNAPMYLGSALFRLITNSALLDCIQDVVGTEIYSNPVQHVRLKPPGTSFSIFIFSYCTNCQHAPNDETNCTCSKNEWFQKRPWE